MQKDRVTITLDPDLLARIDRLADLRGWSRSRMMERQFRTAVEEDERTMDHLASPIIEPIVQSIIDHPRLMATLVRLIGDKLSPDEYAKWVEAEPQVRRARDRVRDERERAREHTSTEGL